MLPRPLELLDELVEGIRTGDVHAVANTCVAVGTCRHEYRMHFAVGAVPVVTAQVSGVGCGLVKVCLLRLRLALEFEHDDSAVDEKDDVGPA